MNFYKRYPGDYQRDTGLLSLAEHGAYSLMLDHYYSTERPLPVGPKLYRLLRCATRADRRAVDAVVGQFWVREDGGLVNLRAKAEIDKAQKIRERNRNNGKRGGRPPGGDEENRLGSQMDTQQKPIGKPTGFLLAKQHQTPDTRHQTVRATGTRAECGLVYHGVGDIPPGGGAP